MPEFQFLVEGVAPLPHALTPTLCLRLRVTNGRPEPVHSMLLRCQVHIEPARRRYSENESKALLAVFAEPARWGQTLRPFLWQQATVLVSQFTGTTVSEILLTCGHDFALAATQYCEALEEGDIPLRLFFSGTAFCQGARGVEVAPVPWDLEASYPMPAQIWRDCIALHYPDCGWLRLRRDVFDRLRQIRMENGDGDWDATLERLLRRPDNLAQRKSA